MPEEKRIIEVTANRLITEHFGYDEPNICCPCCSCLKIVPGFFRHMELLERLRMKAGFPIRVNSGYRCERHNKAVGGAASSWHLLFATDLDTEDNDPKKLVVMREVAEDLGFLGIGVSASFLHLDLRPNKTVWRY